jgi:hypothetical protein
VTENAASPISGVYIGIWNFKVKNHFSSHFVSSHENTSFVDCILRAKPEIKIIKVLKINVAKIEL